MTRARARHKRRALARRDRDRRNQGTVAVKRITTQALAEKCGVSRGTVDRALNGRGEVNSQTREKILALAKQHNYRPNLIGQALSSKRTRTVGIVIFDFRHSFFAELYSAFEHEAETFNYLTLPMLSYHDPARERECLHRLVDRGVDALIVLPVNSGPAYEKFLKSLELPIVAIANRLSSAFPFAGIDDRQAAQEATAYLAAQGHRRIFYLCPPLARRGTVNMYAQEQRLLGYREGLAAAQVAGGVMTDMSSLLDQLQAVRPDERPAVFCSNDFHALDLQLLLRQQRPRLALDVQIMGFDGLDVLKFSYPRLPTIGFSREEWALKAFGQVYRLLSGGKAADELIAHRILPGEAEAAK